MKTKIRLLFLALRRAAASALSGVAAAFGVVPPELCVAAGGRPAPVCLGHAADARGPAAPLTDVELWGCEAAGQPERPAGWCIAQNIPCPAWDERDGCCAMECVA